MYCIVRSLIQLLPCKLCVNSCTVDQWSHVGHTSLGPACRCCQLCDSKVRDSYESRQWYYCIHSTRCSFNTLHISTTGLMTPSLSWGGRCCYVHSHVYSGHCNHGFDTHVTAMDLTTPLLSWIGRCHHVQVSNDVATTSPWMMTTWTTTNW